MVFNFLKNLGSDDIFISYTRLDASTYAAGLADELTKKGFSCFIDKLETDPNANLPDSIKRKIRDCSMLVVVCTERAATRQTIEAEVTEFLRTGRRSIVPVDFGGAVYKARWYKLIEGIAPESEANPLEGGDPSPSVIRRIEKQFNYTRRNERLRRATFATAAILAVLVLASVAAGTYAAQELRAAKAAGVEADAARAQAAEEKVKAEAARQEAETAQTVADKAKADVSEQKRLAKIASDDAAEKTKLAATAARKAQAAEKLEREAKERAAEAARLEEGTRASVLARTPGRDFDALRLAAHAARREFSAAAQPAPQIVDGLVASVSAADDGIPLRDTVGAVTYTQISPNGSKVFAETYAGGVVTWGVWDARTGALLESLQTPPHLRNEFDDEQMLSQFSTLPEKKVSGASFSGDARRLAVLDKDDHLRIWDLEKQTTADFKKPEPPLYEFTNASGIGLMQLNGDGRRLAVTLGVVAGSGSTTFKVVDTDKAVRLKSLDAAAVETFNVSDEVEGAYAELVGFTHDGEPMLCLSRRLNGSTEQRSLYFPRSKTRRDLREGAARVLGFSDNDLPIFKFDPRLDRQDLFAEMNPDASYSIFQPDASYSIFQWEGEAHWQFSGYGGYISSSAVAGGHAYVVTLSGGQARVHGLRADEGFAVLRGHSGPVTGAAFSPDGRRVAVIGGNAMLWDVPTGRLLHQLSFSTTSPSMPSMVNAAAFNADGSRLVMTTDYSVVPEFWDVPAGDSEPMNRTAKCDPVKLHPGHLDPASKMDWPTAYMYQPKGVAFLPDAQGLPGRLRVVSMYVGGYIAVWELGKCEFQEFQLGENSKVVALSADGATALTISNKNGPVVPGNVKGFSVSLWDLRGIQAAGGKPIRLDGGDRWTLPSGRFEAAYVRGHDVRVLLLQNDGRLVIWRPSTNKVPSLAVTEGAVHLAVFSPDGSKLAVLVKDNRSEQSIAVEVWDAVSGKHLTSIPGDFDLASGVNSNPLALSGDGSRLLIGYADHTVRIYPTAPRGFLGVASRILAQ